MAQYLIIAHQTATSPELAEAVRRLAETEPAAAFTLLVPATPVDHLLTWTEGESLEVARLQAERGRENLERVGARIVRTAVGDASPLQAVLDEERESPYWHDGFIISTFAPGFSRWLGMDLPSRVKRKFRKPVIHVVGERSKIGSCLISRGMTFRGPVWLHTGPRLFPRPGGGHDAQVLRRQLHHPAPLGGDSQHIVGAGGHFDLHAGAASVRL